MAIRDITRIFKYLYLTLFLLSPVSVCEMS